MSQHHFYTRHDGSDTHVSMGWDRPLQGFFLVIQKETDRDAPFWSNLDTADPHPKDLKPFLLVLQNFHIEIPSNMIDEIKKDKLHNVGNKEVIHKLTVAGYERIEGDNSDHLWF